MMNLIFPTGRAYRVFQKTGNPWVTLILGLIAGLAMVLTFSSADAADFDISGTGTVSWVADGDTMTVTPSLPQLWGQLRSEAVRAQQATSRNLRVDDRFNRTHKNFLTRIAVIDTAESNHPDDSRNTPAGDTASRYAKNLMTGKQVEFRCYEIGYYGRPICSLETSDFDFGRHMIRQDMSTYVTRYGNHPFEHEIYVRATRQ